ncbi:MAG: VWA domain-containing protein [Acidobacteriota bacterium]|nr:VWA domain-containing protein [Acidobacteriota bacterium]
MKLTTDALWFLCLFAFAALCAPAQEVRDRRVNIPSAPPTSDARPAGQPETTEDVDENGIVRVDTVLVTVPVSVTDRDGRYVSDLRREDFSLYEDGVEQNIAHFAAVEKPFTVVLMLDTSASTWSKLGQIREAALAFVEQLRPDDQVMIASFARGLTIKCEPTGDREKIREAIRDTGKGLSTHLYDAIAKLMEKHLNKIQGRKAVVLFTDGVDATSDHATYESTVHTAQELDALIYPIYYDTYDPASDTGKAPSPPTGSRLPSILRKIPLPVPVSGGTGSGGAGSSRADYDRGERYLRDLARLTGGRVYEASKDLRYLQACFSQIAEELRHQYSLGYYPRRRAKAGERRRIKVSVERPDLAVRSRDSYIYKPASGAVTGREQDKAQTPDGSPVLKPKQLAKTGRR